MCDDAIRRRSALLDDLDWCLPLTRACLNLRCGLHDLIRLPCERTRRRDVRLNRPAVVACIRHAGLVGGRLNGCDLAGRRALLDDLHLTPSGRSATVLDLLGGLRCLIRVVDRGLCRGDVRLHC